MALLCTFSILSWCFFISLIEIQEGFLVQVFKCMSDQSHCTVSFVDLYLNVSGKISACRL